MFSTKSVDLGLRRIMGDREKTSATIGILADTTVKSRALTFGALLVAIADGFEDNGARQRAALVKDLCKGVLLTG